MYSFGLYLVVFITEDNYKIKELTLSWGNLFRTAPMDYMLVRTQPVGVLV